MIPPGFTIRHEVRPGDLGNVVLQHGVSYAREYGFDATFEAYVAGPLAEFVLHPTPRARLWIAERDDRFAGCIAIVPSDATTAQLRWYLVAPDARGHGLGRALLTRAIEFSRRAGYRSVLLWTVSALTDAARLYRSAGFTLTESIPARRWSVDVVEEKYTLPIAD